MKRFLNFAAAAMLTALAACGGGGGGSTGTASGTGSTGGTSVTCPDGTSAATTAACPAVVATTTALPSLAPVDLDKGIAVSFSGALDPNTVKVALTQNGTKMYGATTLADGNRQVTFNSSVRVGYNQPDKLVITGTDSLGGAVSATYEFTTSAMSCASSAVWSNPAALDPAVQDCVAPIGVQAVVDPVATKMQDTSCRLTAGQKLSADCMQYAVNGTFLFADTQFSVQDHPVLWLTFLDSNGAGTLALIDKTTLVTLGAIPVQGIAWIEGGVTGLAVNVGATISHNGGTVISTGGVMHRATWDGASIQFN